MEIINTDLAEIYFDRGDSILHIKLREGAKITLDNCRQHYELIRKITENKKHVSLVDATNFFTIDKEALRLSSASKTRGNLIATAYYTTNLANRLTTNFFIAFYRPAFPISLFKTKEEALAWLKENKF